MKTLALDRRQAGGEVASAAHVEGDGSSDAIVMRAGRSKQPPADTRVVLVVLANIASDSRGWGWLRLVLQRWPLRHVPGLQFSKVLGSGQGGGFGLKPSASHQGLFLVFDAEASARRFMASSALLAAYRARAQELCVALAQPCSSKGSWSGLQFPAKSDMPHTGAVVSLTRASIRLSRAYQFWRMQPAAERALVGVPGVLLAAGVGEAPLLRQATFTVWRSVADMDAYARSGAHGAAIRAAYAGRFFSESMFVRFRPLEISGTWRGQTLG